MEENSTVYGLQSQARSLAALLGDSDRNRFLVGSLGLTNENTLHLLDFDEDTMDISSCIFPYQNEIWHISANPKDESLIFLCDKVVKNNKLFQTANLIRLENNQDDTDIESIKISGTTEKLASLSTSGVSGGFKSVFWDPDAQTVCGISSDGKLGIFKLEQGKTELDFHKQIDTKTSPNFLPLFNSTRFSRIEKGIWDPNNSQQIGIAIGSNVFGYDIRSDRQSFSIQFAHESIVNDFDFNPNRPYHLATGGDDCMVRFWDTRNSEIPILEIHHHTHWISSIAYNRYHDQLFLSSSTDFQVNLESIFSISSASYASDLNNADDIIEDEFSSKPVDGLVSSYDQHEDSVYSVAWSGSDPWTFASLSYDGRVVVNQVPQQHKYKIIL